jgi:transcriptional regulator with XRE-family HTH domain
MEIRNEIREFLASRRARITPQQAGLPAYGGHRRVPGLRREEVALLAGVSVDYYTQMERGHLGGVSDSVLDALARTLQLDEAERAHLAILRGEAGRNPYDRRLSDLVGELATRSEEFRTRWGAHNVRLHRTGRKQLHHPVAGDLELTYEALELPADTGLTMITYTAQPASHTYPREKP